MGFFRLATGSSLLFLGFAGSASANVDVSSWVVYAYVYNGANGQDSIVGYNQVMNPFQASHTAMLGISYATGTYDFAWSADGGSFNVGSSNGAAGNPINLFSSSSGNIILTTTSAYLLDVDALYNFHLLGGDRQALLNVFVGDGTTGQFLFYGTWISAPITGDPAIGSFAVQLTFQLQEGHTYGLGYTMAIDSYSGSPSVLATGDGFINFTFTPIPEPASAALLALGLPWLLRRR